MAMSGSGEETGIGGRTWADVPLGLECGYTRETTHREEIEERLRDVAYDGGLRHDQLWRPVSHSNDGSKRMMNRNPYC